MRNIILFGLILCSSYSLNAVLTESDKEKIKTLHRTFAHQFAKKYPIPENLDLNSAKAFEKSVQAYADAFYRAHEEDIRNHVLAHLEKTKKKDVDDYIHEHLKSKTIVHVKLMTAQSYLKEHPNDAPDFLREIAAHE